MTGTWVRRSWVLCSGKRSLAANLLCRRLFQTGTRTFIPSIRWVILIYLAKENEALGTKQILEKRQISLTNDQNSWSFSLVPTKHVTLDWAALSQKGQRSKKGHKGAQGWDFRLRGFYTNQTCIGSDLGTRPKNSKSLWFWLEDRHFVFLALSANTLIFIYRFQLSHPPMQAICDLCFPALNGMGI